MSKHKQSQSVLASNLRLLVLLRESLRAEGTPEDNALLKAVVTQANLCGIVLPNKLRVSKTELDVIRKGAGLIKAESKATESGGVTALPGAGQMIVLTPEQLAGVKK